MTDAIPAPLQSGCVYINDMQASLCFTSGTIKANPMINFLYMATQLKSGYCTHSDTINHIRDKPTKRQETGSGTTRK